MPRILPSSLLLAALLLAGACLGQEPPETRDIVSTIPWPDRERAEYVLLDRDGEEEQGRGVLSVQRQNGRFELDIQFEGQGVTDSSRVVVDAETLRPVSVRRERRGDDIETKIVDAQYDAEEGVAEITEVSEDGQERLVPLRLEEHYYENESSLYLWRTIPFQEGYEASYHSVLANFRQNNLVTVEVAGTERIETPAGAFEAWRVEIRSGDVEQIAWYADTPERPLVQYDNSRQLFRLTELSG